MDDLKNISSDNGVSSLFFSSDTGASLADTFSLAQDRSQWRAVATAAEATHIGLD